MLVKVNLGNIQSFSLLSKFLKDIANDIQKWTSCTEKKIVEEYNIVP